MKYFPKNENAFNVPEDYEQAFFKDPMLTTDLTASIMLKTKGIIDKTDIRILKYIYETKFCTGDQLMRFCKYKGIEEDEVEARLNIMFTNTLINKFGFVEEENYRGSLPDDIQIYYCLHDGGKHLLDNFSGEDFIDWQAGYVVCHVKNVVKTLIGAEFYTQFYTAETPLVYHTKRPTYSIKSDRFTGGDVYSMSKDGVPYYYAVDTFLSSDRTNMVRNKLRGYESVFNTQIWKRYYVDGGQPPILIFVTDNDKSAAALTKEISSQFRFGNGFLISTKDRLLTGLTKSGSLLIYNSEKNSLEPANLNF
ncbi:MAG: hypothetical protein IKW90_06970 [Lachnospiraceae bacterium]|nr:hypothetical protein [Lachnospiraceae bacterium]